MRPGSLRGFTLIELMFVVAIVAILSTIVVPRASNLLGINLKTGATKVAGFLRVGYEQSVMRHERIRIRLDLENQRYWAETFQEGSLVVPPMDDSTKLEDAFDKFEKMQDEYDPMKESDEENKDQEYQRIDTGSLKPMELPDHIKFKGIYLPNEAQVATTGIQSVEFSPGGFSSKTIIYVANENGDAYSIILLPIGGRSRIQSGEVRPDEV